MLTIVIKTDNAAFGASPQECAQELANILFHLAHSARADRIRPGITPLHDTNGNRVGAAVWTED